MGLLNRIKSVVYVGIVSDPIVSNEKLKVNDDPQLLHAGLAIIAALLYVGTSARQLICLDRQGGAQREPSVIDLAVGSVAFHAILAWLELTKGGVDLGFYKVASFIFLAISVLSLLALLIRPLHMMIIATFPLAALAVLLNVFAPATGRPMLGLESGLIIHISLSLTAFGILTIAVTQAAVVSAQARKLRQHEIGGFIRLLPPLDLMETMLYELLTVGTAVLSVAIATGMVFVDDFFAQHLVHKAVLTVIGWCIFSVTLFVHWRSGWRVGTAVSLAFTGYSCLLLGFFGSKLVLELLL